MFYKIEKMNMSSSINSKINLIIKENISLKNALKLYQEKENLYKLSILKIKKYQSEYKKSFIKIINDYKNHEDKIKKTYISYHKLLERHYKSCENRFIEENNSLYMQIGQKNNIIKVLSNKINKLNKKLNKTEFDFNYKNKKLEDEVILKEKKLNHLNRSMIQLAKDTNDEIKLLRDEFNIYRNENKKNKSFRVTEGNFNNLFESSYINENISIDKNIYTNQEINFLKNKLYLLEYQNKNLTEKLIRKEEELSICNNLKNELIYQNKINNKYSFSIDKQSNEINNLIFEDFEKKMEKLGNKIKHLKTLYDKSLIRHQNEIEKIKNIYKNNNPKTNINKNNTNQIIENNNYNQDDKIINNNDYDNNFNNEYFNNYDINEFQMTNKVNNKPYDNYEDFQNNNFNIEDDEEIKDEYINSLLPKINTLD